MGETRVTGPRVSVVVPTRNRASSLAALLASLGEQTFDGSFEVIVVDDGSSDATRDAVCAAGDNFRCERTESAGAVEARCAGVRAARGGILAFIDDDCVADRDWLRAGVEQIDAGADVVQGKTIAQRPVMPLERTVSHAPTDGLFPTCNVFYRRSAYDRAGGFDRFAGDRLGFRGNTHARRLGFGEDTLLGWTVARIGRFAPAPGAVVQHEVVRTSVRDLLSRAWLVGAFPALLREVPELRRTVIFKRCVLGRPDARLSVYGLALLAFAPSRPLGIAALGWWIAARTRQMLRRPGPLIDRAAGVPVELAIDVTKAAALVVGSARARLPVI